MALFTCYVTRAVHLDAVTDQFTPAFIKCLKRFVARRGLPRQFISKNGKTFKAASKYLDTTFKDGSVQEHLTGLGVTWQFNVERALWWGGAFERMVRSTKRCLKKLIGRDHLSRWATMALAEIEAVLNFHHYPMFLAKIWKNPSPFSLDRWSLNSKFARQFRLCMRAER